MTGAGTKIVYARGNVAVNGQDMCIGDVGHVYVISDTGSVGSGVVVAVQRKWLLVFYILQ